MLSSVVLIGLFFKFIFLSVLFCARTNANHFALPKAILIFYYTTPLPNLQSPGKDRFFGCLRFLSHTFAILPIL